MRSVCLLYTDVNYTAIAVAYYYYSLYTLQWIRWSDFFLFKYVMRLFVGCALLKNVTFDFIMRRPLVSSSSSGSSSRAHIECENGEQIAKKWCKQRDHCLINTSIYICPRRKERKTKNAEWQVAVQQIAQRIAAQHREQQLKIYDYLSGWLVIYVCFVLSLLRCLSTSRHLFVVMVRKTMFICTFCTCICCIIFSHLRCFRLIAINMRLVG